MGRPKKNATATVEAAPVTEAVKDTKAGKRLKLHIKAILASECLGTAPSDPNVYLNFIASRSDKTDVQDEVDAVKNKVKRLTPSVNNTDGDETPRSLTIFPCLEDGTNVMFDYQIKGFLKEACHSLRYDKGSDVSKESCGMAAFKSKIDDAVFVYPRQIKISLPEGMTSTLNTRSLRAQTAKGERITIASSEAIPAGSIFEFDITCPSDFRSAVIEWLNYGEKKGLLQWRSGGKGTFTYVIKSEEYISSESDMIKADSSNKSLAGKSLADLRAML